MPKIRRSLEISKATFALSSIALMLFEVLADTVNLTQVFYSTEKGLRFRNVEIGTAFVINASRLKSWQVTDILLFLLLSKSS